MLFIRVPPHMSAHRLTHQTRHVISETYMCMQRYMQIHTHRHTLTQSYTVPHTHACLQSSARLHKRECAGVCMCVRVHVRVCVCVHQRVHGQLCRPPLREGEQMRRSRGLEALVLGLLSQCMVAPFSHSQMQYGDAHASLATAAIAQSLSATVSNN